MSGAIVAIFSVFLEREHIDDACAALKTLNPTSISTDINAHTFAGNLGVVQAYFHIETSNYSADVKMLRSQFVAIKTSMTATTEQRRKFIAFAEHWFCDPNTLFPSDFTTFFFPQRHFIHVMNKDYGNGKGGKVMFVDRPTYESDLRHAVTLIEVPVEVQLNQALELAHHKQHALQCILCSVDLLTSKASWLGQNAISKLNEHPDVLIEKLFDDASNGAAEDKLLGRKSNLAADLLRPLTSVSTLLPLFEMTEVMLQPIERQLSHFKIQLFNDAALLNEPATWSSTYPFPVDHAFADIDSLKRSLAKFTGLLRGIREIQQAKTTLALSEKEDIAKAIEKATQNRFNFLTLLLAVAAAALATTAIVDNDSAKAFLDLTRPSWRQGINNSKADLIVFGTKLGIAALTTVIAGILAFILHKWQKRAAIK